MANLQQLLEQLLEACGGSLVAIVDEGNGLWCTVRSASRCHVAAGLESVVADRFYHDEIAPRAHQLRRGIKLSIRKPEGETSYLAESFASIYVLVMWFEGPCNAELVGARMRRALPGIESIIISLPPNGGPGADESAGKQRA